MEGSLPLSPTFKSPPVPGAGRKSDYKIEYCDQLVEHMSRGYSLESFAGKIGIHRSILYDWRDAHPEFKEAMLVGTDKSLLFYESLGIQGMAGKLKGFNASVYALTMANKHKWRQQHDVTSDGEKLELPVLYIPNEED